jgi:PAS domain S-box-containing protein
MFGDWPTGESETAARIRAIDWSGSPLGPAERWPQSLRTALDVCLDSGFPSCVWWGPELIQFYNDPALPILCAKHPAALGAPAATVWPEIWPDMGPLIAEVLASSRPATRCNMPLQLERGAGAETAFFTFAFSPLRDETGAVAGVMGVALDTTARLSARGALFQREAADPVRMIGAPQGEARRAVEALHDSEERFDQFAEAAADVLWIRDADTLQWEYLSPSFQRVYGLTLAEAMSGDTLETWAALILPADREAALNALKSAGASRTGVVEYRIQRPDSGEQRWIRDTLFPIRNAAGLRRIGGVGHDITEEKTAAHHQTMLLAELQHRTRNLLGVIRSMAKRTAETSDDLESFLTHFDGRLSAIARTQTALTRDHEISAGLDALILEEFLAAVGAEQVTLDGPDVQLNGKLAESISLAVHELVTNALKYGALTSPKGHVHVTWDVGERDGRPMLALEWRETGVSVIDPHPKRMGFGRRLLEKALPYELGAETTLQFAPGGLRARVVVPLPPPNGRGPVGD